MTLNDPRRAARKNGGGGQWLASCGSSGHGLKKETPIADHGDEGVAVSQKLSHEAVEWFVLNESAEAEDAELAQRWVEWCAEPANRAEYACMLQLAQEMRELPPPVRVSRKELMTDVAAREEDPSMSRTG
jgi:hypothetical protein